MKKKTIIAIVVVVLVLIVGYWVIGGLNFAVILDENVKLTWSQVENQLQRRNDLVPNLVKTVKAYAFHEKELFSEVTRLRNQWAQAQTTTAKIDTAQAMGSALSKLLLVAESYPDLKASQNFLTLQSQLEGTENRIAVERMRYNQAVQIFNSYKRTVFGSLFTKLRGLSKPAVYFESEEGAKEKPKVEF
jgi:LemA protein